MENISFVFKNTSDGEAFSFSFETEIMAEMIDEQHRLEIMIADDTGKYTQTFVSTTVNYCRFLKGVVTNTFVRVIAENFFQSLNQNYSCPYSRGTKVVVKDCVCPDTYFPLIFTEKQMKITDNVFGKVKGRKGWINVFSLELFIRFKR
jgi:Protein of unknown function (DUF1091)